MLRLDHLVVRATELAEGVTWTEAAVGQALLPGGTHTHFGTHNKLLGLDDLYLEVIAIDPAAQDLQYTRWYDLDAFGGPTALGQWAVATDNLNTALEILGPAYGTPIDLARGDLRWRMAVPSNGQLPFDTIAPAIIEWQSDVLPPARLPVSGLSLETLTISHPKADVLAAQLEPYLNDARIVFQVDSAIKLSASLMGEGRRWHI